MSNFSKIGLINVFFTQKNDSRYLRKNYSAWINFNWLSKVNKQQKYFNPYLTLSLRGPATQPLHNEGRRPESKSPKFWSKFWTFVQNVSNFSRNVRNLGQNLEHYKLIRLKILNIISSVFGRNIGNLGQHLDHYKIFAQMLSEIWSKS